MNEASLQTVAQDWGIIGHEHAINTLRRALVTERVRHAYLFTGPEHIGKALLARRFAQTLLCTGGPDPRMAPQNPCNVCLSCRKVMHNNHPDVHYIARPPDKQFILIDQVRALQSDSARKTLEGRRNVFIIQGMHEMNVQAANCLLKTLEEPEPDVVLLLTAPLRLARPCSRLARLTMPTIFPFSTIGTRLIRFFSSSAAISPSGVSGLAVMRSGDIGGITSIFTRGGESDYTKVLVDGIPVNLPNNAHGQGYADLHWLIPETVDHIEVTKGPYFVQYGDFATAATILAGNRNGTHGRNGLWIHIHCFPSVGFELPR